MQAQNIRRTFPSYFKHSNGAERVDFYSQDFFHRNSGWPVIRGDHKTPLPHNYDVLTSSGRGLQTTDYGSSWFTHDVGCATSVPLPNDYSVAYNKALDQLNDKVRGGLDLSVDSFQAKQTGRMFHAASQAEDLARGLSRSGVGKLRLIGSLWLQFQYGWLPTLGSVYGIADESLRYILNNLSTYKGSGTVKNHGTIVLSDGWYSIPSRYEDLTQVKIAVTVDNSKVLDLARWTSLNPISIAWELLPYSFVVDWLYDVGGFLRNAETGLLYGRSFQNGYISTFQRRSCEQLSFYQMDGYNRVQGSATANRRNFSRKLIYSYPLPAPPKLQFSLGSGRLLNAAGLLSQFLGSRK